jgi:hypothetical protein
MFFFFFARSLARGARRRANRPPYVPYPGPHNTPYKVTRFSVTAFGPILAIVLIAVAIAIH